MATSSTHSYDGPGAFSRLPYDTRVLIYEFALSRVDALEIVIFSSAASPRTDTATVPTASVLNKVDLTPAILRLNKEINSESMPFLYARNTFAFAGLEECSAFTDPAIPGRALISRISLPRLAMSRPNVRWNSLHTFLPSNLRQLTIEIDTYSKSLHTTCHNLCRGLELYLQQVDSEPAARWAHFRDVVMLRLPATKGLAYQILDARAACSTESQKLVWQRLGESTFVSNAATHLCFEDMIRDTLIGAGVFGAVHGRA
jgi:hypothetical protein